MEVVLLGTGAADGWPNPFCDCDSCRIMLARGQIRAQTAALVDDVLLLDCGHEAPRSALRAGRSLSGVRHLLLTHAHPDHVGPMALLMRSWVTGAPLDVIGPSEALDLCRDWVGPDGPVRWIPVAPGDVVDRGGYRVRVLGAAHRVQRDGDCVLYEVSDRAGRKLLWATDTGPFLSNALEQVRGAGYDTVFLEETFGDLLDHAPDHLDLHTFGQALAALRDVGAVTDRTDVIAVHLGHHNPVDLPDRLRPCGARVVDDGTVVMCGDQPNGSEVRPTRSATDSSTSVGR
ncbi:MBL fold metallo-hydrolase [Prescottella subtropica]|uniref:MBL fold metallo-hydrolase n=1 Tax=Prescottella subtropica TaxID=2545757 RepID=UPI0010F473B5|nr:MBL fold metallo-hydrolase [Prescottella subtropica]